MSMMGNILVTDFFYSQKVWKVVHEIAKHLREKL